MTSFYLLDNPQPNTQQWGYPRRGAKLSGTVIIHTAECALDLVGEDTSAEGTAKFIWGRLDYGSYHVLCDSDSTIWMAPWEYETWQDSQTNPWAVGISAAVQAANWHLIPVERRNKIIRNMAVAAADFVQYMKAAYGITVPLRRITGAEARARVPGFCAHGDSGVDRYDPGAQFDWDLFFKYTAEALATTTTPAKKETTEVAAHKHIQVKQPAGGRRLAKGATWYLKDAAGKLNQNFAVAGVGNYDIDLFLQGTGLPAGESIAVQFIIKNGKNTSGYYSQEIRGDANGNFQPTPVRLKRAITAGTILEVGVTSSCDTASLTLFGAEIRNYN